VACSRPAFKCVRNILSATRLPLHGQLTRGIGVARWRKSTFYSWLDAPSTATSDHPEVNLPRSQGHRSRLKTSPTYRGADWTGTGGTYRLRNSRHASNARLGMPIAYPSPSRPRGLERFPVSLTMVNKFPPLSRVHTFVCAIRSHSGYHAACRMPRNVARRVSIKFVFKGRPGPNNTRDSRSSVQNHDVA